MTRKPGKEASHSSAAIISSQPRFVCYRTEFPHGASNASPRPLLLPLTVCDGQHPISAACRTG